MPDFGQGDVPAKLTSAASRFVETDSPPEWIRHEAYDDPNVGLGPTEEDPDSDDDYIPPLSDRGEELDLWERLTAASGGNHLGGIAVGEWATRESRSVI